MPKSPGKTLLPDLWIAIVTAAGRMAVEDHTELAECFPDPLHPHRVPISRLGTVLGAQSRNF